MQSHLELTMLNWIWSIATQSAATDVGRFNTIGCQPNRGFVWNGKGTLLLDRENGMSTADMWVITLITFFLRALHRYLIIWSNTALEWLIDGNCAWMHAARTAISLHCLVIPHDSFVTHESVNNAFFPLDWSKGQELSHESICRPAHISMSREVPRGINPVWWTPDCMILISTLKHTHDTSLYKHQWDTILCARSKETW